MILSDDQKKQLIALRLDKADEALNDASTLITHGSLRGVMNRCYYAVFYAASALAIRDGRTFHKHRGLISWFHQEYMKTGHLPKHLGRFFQKAFSSRCEADYEDVSSFPAEDVPQLLDDARRFVAELKSFLATP